MPKHQNIALSGIGLALLILAGCSSTYFSTTAGAGATTGVATSTPTTQPAATEPITTVGPTGGTPTPGGPATATPIPPGGTMTPGAVTLALSATSYTAGQPIVVTIHNGLNTTIMTADHKTNCSMVTLQMQTANGWVDLAPCKLMIATRLVELAAQSATPIALGSGTQAATANWGAGTYRVMFTYGTTPQNAPVGAGIIYSATFTIS